ncbi:hypothetical protein [Paenibacillus amylolyticus]|nr:hypothetical protein [Paenibacillus amylolyticus]
MNKEQENEISYVVISEEVARSSKSDAIIIKPFVKVISDSLPYHLSFCISFGFVVQNIDLENMVIEISNSEGVVIDAGDITGVHFNNDELFDESGKRRDALLIGEAGLNNNTGISLESYGKYNIHIKRNGEVVGNTFFILSSTEGDKVYE